jgi:hypothetical protein
VPRAISPVFRRLSDMLRDQFDQVVREPLPRRWVDLINLLNERERQEGLSRAGEN